MPENKNGIVMECILNKLEQDKEGLWSIKLIADSSQADAVLSLSRNTQKIIKTVFFPEEEQPLVGRLVD